MKILIASSEAVPFAKTGGLADVAGALPRALRNLGHDPCLFMPFYRKARKAGIDVKRTGIELVIPVGNRQVRGELWQSQLPSSDVPVYLVDQPEYFDRDELYGVGGEDYRDNCERFVFFSRAVIESIRRLKLETECIHCNDWQTGLIPAYLQTEFRDISDFEDIGTLFTVHNLGYQGSFWHWDMLLTGIDWKYFNWNQMEFYGHLNLLKTGLVFADVLSTVSPRYAREIQTPEFGSGLEGVLNHRRDDLYGIINGIDYDVWNPAIDAHLVERYDTASVSTGKAACKAALQALSGLPTRDDAPLIGMITRLADQKGLDLVAAIAKDLLEEDLQFVVLGTGDPKYHELFQQLARSHPNKVAAHLTFNDGLAHQIEAGSDMFLMPSRYEPCGLNQLYSLKYGTVPIVREVGGLADSIVDATAQNITSGTATGFSFSEYAPHALFDTVTRALSAYRKRDVWKQIIQTGMRQDWSWARGAREYIELYNKAICKKKAAVCV